MGSDSCANMVQLCHVELAFHMTKVTIQVSYPVWKWWLLVVLIPYSLRVLLGRRLLGSDSCANMVQLCRVELAFHMIKVTIDVSYWSGS